MKSLKLQSILLLAFALLALPSFGQGLKAFKLKNGLSVYIWEDNTKSDVYGIVACRTGSVNDPAEYTGLAHYLEHVMFKGTDKIGALDWEKEKPIYEQIIAKYDEMAEETDPLKKEAIGKEINDLTVEEGKISVSNEFMNLIESMGGKGLNAGTSYDVTYYHNSFPPYQINKWLEIYSQRLINPVFRLFQTELESVYEEYNMYQDDPGSVQREFISSKAFEGHPYARPIIGLPEHLKNPRLSKLIEFYNNWYTPENMVLILVGNVNAQQISGRINATFGRLPKRPTPERKTYPDLDIKGRKQYTAKVGYYPMVCLAYKGVPSGHPDEKPLEIAMSLLHNSSNTGTLDKLTLDGELTSCGASTDFRREQGRNMVYAIPLYDENQRRFESNKSAEKKALKAIEQIANGEFEDWQIEAIKANMCRDFDLTMESNTNKAMILMQAFINEEDLGKVLSYKDEIMAITTEDIKRVAKQYLTGNYLALYIEKARPTTAENQKARLQAHRTARRQAVALRPAVQEHAHRTCRRKVHRLYRRAGQEAERPLEDVLFGQSRKQRVQPHPAIRRGRTRVPQAGHCRTADERCRRDGCLPAPAAEGRAEQAERHLQRKRQRQLPVHHHGGLRATLPQACQLLSRQILMPQLDEKQLARIKGSLLGARQQRKENVNTLSSALMQYMIYQDKSSFIDELTDKEIYELSISELTGDINRAANYEAEIFYCGTMPFDNAYDILSKNLPLVANERPSTSPQDKPLASVTENTVYFLPNSDAEQAQIWFFMPLGQYDKKDDVLRDAFNQYFSGGFNGLVMNEIREKRSMAYSAGAYIGTPALPGNPTYLFGNIGTQNDKANDALDVFMGLVTDMPKNADRIDNIKSYMRQEALTTHPSFRSKAETLNSLQRVGYSEDPAKENLPKIDALTFDDIVKFYEDNIKGKPYCIGIMGNPKDIDVKKLEKYGKVVRLSDRKLFNTKDTLF